MLFFSGSSAFNNSKFLFRKTGDCNCDCYNKNNLPNETRGKCFCQAPTSCKCVAGKCEGGFE